MTEVAVIGRQVDVGGFALAGAHVYCAETADEIHTAWRSLPDAVGFVLLTAAAAVTLDADLHEPGAPLTAVLP